MIRTTLFFIAIALAPASAQASGWANDLFSSFEHDWGKVERGAQLTHHFTLTNNTGREVRIKSLNVSCHCTTAMTSTYRIAAGETAIIDAHMDTSGFLGSKSVTIFVRFDRPYRAEVSLRVSAISSGDVNAGPNEIDFGLVSSGAGVEKHLNLDYAGNDAWQIKGIDYNAAHLSASYREAGREAGKGVRYELTLKLLPTAPVGTLEEKIRVRTNDAKTPEFIVLAKAKVEAKVSLTPDSFKAENLAPGAEITRNVIIKADAPFRIIRAANTAGLFKVRSAGEDRTSQLVVLSMTVPADPSTIPDHIELVTNLPENKTIIYPINKGDAK
jgi:hypothetical protein